MRHGNAVEEISQFPSRVFVDARGAGDPSSSGADIRIPLSVASTKGVLFEVVKAIWQVNSGRRGHRQIPNKVIARLVESAEQATKQKIKGAP